MVPARGVQSGGPLPAPSSATIPRRTAGNENPGPHPGSRAPKLSTSSRASGEVSARPPCGCPRRANGLRPSGPPHGGNGRGRTAATGTAARRLRRGRTAATGATASTRDSDSTDTWPRPSGMRRAMSLASRRRRSRQAAGADRATTIRRTGTPRRLECHQVSQRCWRTSGTPTTGGMRRGSPRERTPPFVVPEPATLGTKRSTAGRSAPPSPLCRQTLFDIGSMIGIRAPTNESGVALPSNGRAPIAPAPGHDRLARWSPAH